MLRCKSTGIHQRHFRYGSTPLAYGQGCCLPDVVPPSACSLVLFLGVLVTLGMVTHRDGLIDLFNTAAPATMQVSTVYLRRPHNWPYYMMLEEQVLS